MNNLQSSRMGPANSVLLIVDVQEQLAPAIQGIEGIIMRNKVLIEAANRFSVPILITEQNPKGLGHTDPSLTELAQNVKIYEKIHFGATDEPDFCTLMDETGKKEIVITGTEAHVCVLQTALGLHELGYRIRFCADAVGSRTAFDKQFAIKRVESENICVVTAEMVLFEWLKNAASDEFFDLLPSIRNLAQA